MKDMILRSIIYEGKRQCSMFCTFYDRKEDSCCKLSMDNYFVPNSECPAQNADLVEVDFSIKRIVRNLEIEGLNQIFNKD